MNQRKVYEYAERFEGDRSSVDTRSGWPSTVTCVEDQSNESIRNNREISTAKIASYTIISHGSKGFKNSLRPS
jgi:hypothetical protein